MKVVFLDFDGVINGGHLIWDGHMNTPEYRRGTEEFRALADIDGDAVKRVDRVCRETGAKVVISSTWRLIHRLADLRKWLSAKGLTADVVGRTPSEKDGVDGPRGAQIQAWLDNEAQRGRGVESFVILDDDSDMAHLMDRLVKTDFVTGLLDEHCTLAIAMLSRERERQKGAG